MKLKSLIYLFILLFLFSFSVSIHAQIASPQYSDNQIYQYDSVKYSFFNSGTWRLGIVKEKIQHPSGTIFMDTYDVNFDSSRTLRQRDIYLFDSNDLLYKTYLISDGGNIGSPLDTLGLRLFNFDNKNNLLSDSSYSNNNGIWELQGVIYYSYDSLNRIIDFQSYNVSQNSIIKVTTFTNSLNFKMDSVLLLTPTSTIFWGIDNTEYRPDGKVDKYFYTSSNLDTTIINSFFYNSQNLLDSVFLDRSFSTAFKYIYDSTWKIQQFIRYTENNSTLNMTSLEEYYMSDLSTGISSQKMPQNIEAYPNPSSGEINFKIENEESNFYQINLYDLNGVRVKSIRNNTNDPKISLEKYTPGLYTFIVVTKDKVYRGKIVLQ